MTEYRMLSKAITDKCKRAKDEWLNKNAETETLQKSNDIMKYQYHLKCANHYVLTHYKIH